MDDLAKRYEYQQILFNADNSMKSPSEIIDTLHHQAAALSEMDSIIAQREWQPIETAPKDGQQFLVSDGDCVVMAEHPDDRLILHDITSVGFESATHWMPLPAPPALTPSTHPEQKEE